MAAHDPAKPKKPFKPKNLSAGTFLLVAAIAGLSPLTHHISRWFGVIALAVFALIYLGLWIWAKNRLRRTAHNPE